MQKIIVGDFVLKILHLDIIGRIQITVVDSKSGNIVGAITAISGSDWYPVTRVDHPINLN
jgi:hypothetical protein